jgi:hypothetical protein
MKLHIIGTANRRIGLRRTVSIESAGGGNDEVLNRCALSFFKNNNDRIPYFDIRYSLLTVRRRRVRYSLFAFSEFLFRFDRPFFWPAAVLTPETI